MTADLSAADLNDWCEYHHRVERYRYWDVCGECLHAFRWRWSLRVAHVRTCWRYGIARRRAWGLFDRRIWVCPLCAHDL